MDFSKIDVGKNYYDRDDNGSLMEEVKFWESFPDRE